MLDKILAKLDPDEQRLLFQSYWGLVEETATAMESPPLGMDRLVAVRHAYARFIAAAYCGVQSDRNDPMTHDATLHDLMETVEVTERTHQMGANVHGVVDGQKG